jgi:hypothetical protein
LATALPSPKESGQLGTQRARARCAQETSHGTHILVIAMVMLEVVNLVPQESARRHAAAKQRCVSYDPPFPRCWLVSGGRGGETLRLSGVIVGCRGNGGRWASKRWASKRWTRWIFPLGGIGCWVDVEPAFFVRLRERARPADSDLPLIILIVPAHLPTFWNRWGLSFRSCHLIGHTMAAPRFLDTTASNRTTEFKGERERLLD